MILNKINIYEKYIEAINDIIQETRIKNEIISINFINQYCFNILYSDKNFKKIIENSEFLLRDGIGIKLALRINNLPSGCNMNGTDFIPELIKNLDTNDSQFFFIGSIHPWVEIAAKKLVKKSIFFVKDGFKEKDEYLKFIQKNISNIKNNIFVLALGMPQQEYLSNEIKSYFTNYRGIIINGGGILDFISNRKKRAPKILRLAGLEWSYRLFIEPKRMFKRYVIGIPIFLFRIIIK